MTQTSRFAGLSLLLMLTGLSELCYSQIPPAIQWQNTLGGSGYEFLWSCNPTADGGAILGGYTNSPASGDKTENTVSFNDMWIVKVDASGNLQWEETIGGSNTDQAYDVMQTADGGYIVAGMSQSGISGDKTEPLLGSADMWILKLDNDGDIEWQNTIGGSANDQAQQIRQTADGGYIIGGWSSSGISTDKTEANMGAGFSTDYWVLKLDASGNIQWQNTIGGSDYEYLYALELTDDGGYIIGGSSESPLSGDKTEANLGSTDYWVLKLDATGNIQWQNTIGGNTTDNLLSIAPAFDQGYVLAGYSYSDITGDKTEVSPGAAADYWIIKINNTGNIVWQTSLGGNGEEAAFDVAETTEHGYIVGGFSYSGMNGDKTEPHLGNGDIWVVKLNSSGALIWQNTIGGSGTDNARAIFQSPADSTFIVTGNSSSPISGDKTENSVGGFGADDYWILKLNRDCFPVAEICNNMDDNCNGLKDDGLIFLDYYTDADADNYGNPASTPINSCQAIAGKVADNTDCNDANNLINPSVAEICNGMDDDCSGAADNGLTFITYYTDADADTYGSISDPGISSCNVIGSASTNNSDCNDADASVHPATEEACNGVDDDCNSFTDDGLVFITYYPDADADNYGNAAATGTSSCNVIAGVEDHTDCNDANAAIHPGVTEICNTLDDDCNSLTDDNISVTISISAGGATTFCQGENVVLTATYTGATLQWKKDGSNIAGATSPTYTATKKGNYSCVTNSACGNATSSAINVTVNKNPPASITAGGPTTFCAGGSVTLTANAGAGLTYKWYKGNTPVAGATSISYTAFSSGNYKCRVTKSATGCYKNSNAIMVSVPCKEGEIPASNDENALSIYPNPNNGTFMITGIISANERKGMTLSIYNSLGQIIYSKQIESPDQIITETVSLDMISGIYFVRIQNDQYRQEQIFFVE